MSSYAQRTILKEAEASFERNLMHTEVGRLDDQTLSVVRKCYCLGFINGGDHVLSQARQVQYS